MIEGKKHVLVAPKTYEMLLIKAETPMNPIAATIKQTQENLNTVRIVLEFLKKKRFDCAYRKVKKIMKSER